MQGHNYLFSSCFKSVKTVINNLTNNFIIIYPEVKLAHAAINRSLPAFFSRIIFQHSSGMFAPGIVCCQVLFLYKIPHQVNASAHSINLQGSIHLQTGDSMEGALLQLCTCKSTIT